MKHTKVHKEHLRDNSSSHETRRARDKSLKLPAPDHRVRWSDLPADTFEMDFITRSARRGLVQVLEIGQTR
jgi:hypothetical protein